MKYFCINHREQRNFISLKSSSFTVITLFQQEDRLILTSKVDPRAVKVKSVWFVNIFPQASRKVCKPTLTFFSTLVMNHRSCYVFFCIIVLLASSLVKVELISNENSSSLDNIKYIRIEQNYPIYIYINNF